MKILCFILFEGENENSKFPDTGMVTGTGGHVRTERRVREFAKWDGEGGEGGFSRVPYKRPRTCIV